MLQWKDLYFYRLTVTDCFILRDGSAVGYSGAVVRRVFIKVQITRTWLGANRMSSAAWDFGTALS